jgi:hypothetical protein
MAAYLQRSGLLFLAETATEGAIAATHDRFAAGFHGGNKARELSFLLDVDGNHSGENGMEIVRGRVCSD